MSKSPVETPDAPLAVRILLLLLLPLIALVIWWEGQRYDQGLLELKHDPAAAANTLLPERLGGLQRIGPPRPYSKENLYEYINGHAEYFISAGFEGLMVGEYAPDGGDRPTLVVNLYDMGRPMHAFGAMMDELAADAEPVEVGAMGFTVGQGVSLIQGRYYLQLSTFGATEAPIEPARELAVVLQQKGGDEEALDLRFPPLGELVSTYFVKEDYRGLGFLNNVLERTFRVDEREITAFLINAQPEEIVALTGRVTAFLDGEGIGYQYEERQGGGFYRVNDPYEGEWFFVPSGPRLLGVFAAPEPGLLERVAPTRAGD